MEFLNSIRLVFIGVSLMGFGIWIVIVLLQFISVI